MKKNSGSLVQDPPEWNKGKVNIKASELKKDREIAGGRYGTVYKGECRGQVVAIKMLHNQHLSQDKLEELRTEVEIMSRLRHPCILLFMGICTEPDNISLVMEYVEGKSLDRILHNHNIHLSDSKKLHLAKDTAKGLNWLHCLDPPIIHRDLKPPNILVGSQFNVKVCDFGLSCVKELREREPDDLEDTAVGSPIWMAPEVLSGHPNTEKSDVYAYGIILWEILTRKAPFSDVTSFDQFLKDIVDHHKRPPLPEDILPSLRKLVEDCWNSDPKKRPSFAQILQRLDAITLESLISDSEGRKIWANLAKKESVGEGYPFFVKWDDFIFELVQQSPPVLNADGTPADTNTTSGGQPTVNPYGVYGVGAACLKMHLSEQYQDETTEKEVRIVRCEEFGNFLKCFGPLQLNSTPKTTANGGIGSSGSIKDEDDEEHGSKPPANIIERFRQVCAAGWFYGAVDTQAAEKRLKGDRGLKKGTFMVRDSSNKTCFTITKVAKDKTILHQRVQNIGGLYTVQVGKKNVKKSSLIELINEVGEELYLKTPFGGENPFTPLLNQKSGTSGENPIYIICDINQLREQVGVKQNEDKNKGEKEKERDGESDGKDKMRKSKGAKEDGKKDDSGKKKKKKKDKEKSDKSEKSEDEKSEKKEKKKGSHTKKKVEKPVV